ncbi:TPA: adenylyl-sulfate kinase [Candidatus Woesearchaeota archaeon]|nr:adenylyl-sulfate kinase [Candidatus Woesearchaeota archaeon]
MSTLETRIRSPIFVFGSPNSGTTILWNALKSHPGVAGPDKEGQDLEGMPKPMTHFLGLHTFRMWAHYLHDQPHSRWGEDHLPGSQLPYYATERDWIPEHQSQLEQIYAQYLTEGKRLCDKSPAHTLRARFLQRCFPDARFIAIVRNGYAVAEGIVRKRKFDPDRPQFNGLPTEIGDAAWQWRRANEVIVSYQDYSLLKNYKIIRYEDLVQEPRLTLSALFEFCGLDSVTLTTPEFEQNLNSRQISRLKPHQIGTISEIAEPMLARFGYTIQNIQKKIYWLTGLPCSGKSTIAQALCGHLDAQILDGDKIRAMVQNRDFSLEGRATQMRYVAAMAYFLHRQQNVIVSLVSPLREVREEIKRQFLNVVEIYVQCDVEVCKRRDVKGMYARASSGVLLNFTAVQQEYEPPLNPHLVVRTDVDSIESCVNQILSYARRDYGEI